MSEVSVASWNAHNAWAEKAAEGDRLDTGRMQDAFEVIKRIDADVIGIQEMAHRDPDDARREGEAEHLHIITIEMAKLGYRGVISDYTPYYNERNLHYMSAWSRLGMLESAAQGDAVQTYGRRHGLRITLPDRNLTITSLHLCDRFRQERLRSVKALLAADEQAETGAEIVASPLAHLIDRSVPTRIVLGDFNDMHRDDPHGRKLQYLGRLANGIEVGEYYDPQKPLRRLIGKGVRLCRMSGGVALAAMEAAGYHDADPNYGPTVGRGRMAFQIDHIMGSSNVVFKDFKTHSRAAIPSGEPLSDHSPISATAVF